ncbi:unnamed protein product [Bursaphelenchus xylophilus]|uniref:(pine wood nematode) hypothetical protein n=1 Tax=Bursaphelenchus xylophilus TaxID=6326 RepID=A0A1I7SED3_BURXY|nr:unnamed protein product [Bursaphelenchus xylophilus]CAG9087524.1 unnamed protein product [Bursaphelenchus xylophilus]
MMMLRSIFGLILIGKIALGDYYGDESSRLFFDPFNFTHLDCIPEGASLQYNYYGKKNKTAEGIPCIKWAEAKKLMKGAVDPENAVYFFAQEDEDHNQCRNLRLDSYRQVDEVSYAIGHFFVDNPSTRKGPWCYVKIKKPVKSWFNQYNLPVQPYACFRKCPGKKIVDDTKTTTTTLSPRDFFHYNLEMIGNLTDSFFDEINFGDAEAYLNPNMESHRKRSEEFEKNQYRLLYAGNGLLIVVCGLLICRKVCTYIKMKKEEETEEEEEENEDENNSKVTPGQSDLPAASNNNLPDNPANNPAASSRPDIASAINNPAATPGPAPTNEATPNKEAAAAKS